MFKASAMCETPVSLHTTNRAFETRTANDPRFVIPVRSIAGACHHPGDILRDRLFLFGSSQNDPKPTAGEHISDRGRSAQPASGVRQPAPPDVGKQIPEGPADRPLAGNNTIANLRRLTETPGWGPGREIPGTPSIPGDGGFLVRELDRGKKRWRLGSKNRGDNIPPYLSRQTGRPANW